MQLAFQRYLGDSGDFAEEGEPREQENAHCAPSTSPKLGEGDTSGNGKSWEMGETEPDTMLTLAPVSKSYLSTVTLFTSCPFPLHPISLERVDKEKKRWNKKELPWEDRERDPASGQSEEICPLMRTYMGDTSISLQ